MASPTDGQLSSRVAQELPGPGDHGWNYSENEITQPIVMSKDPVYTI